MKPGAFATLKERGFVSQCSDQQGLASLLDSEQVTFYIGFDPTASSLHVGHMVQLFAMAHLQRAGHLPIALIGDGTCRIGDPSGKTEMRKILPIETINANADRFRTQISRFLDFSEGRGLMLNNADWLAELNYIDFLRDIGRHFSVNRMLSFETYKMRLDTGLSFIEFNYQILQAYDYLVLHQRQGCRLQMGGDDQWGNIVAGMDLVLDGLDRPEPRYIVNRTCTATSAGGRKKAFPSSPSPATRISPLRIWSAATCSRATTPAGSTAPSPGP